MTNPTEYSPADHHNEPNFTKRKIPRILLGRRDFNTTEIAIANIDTSKNIRTIRDSESYQFVKQSILSVGILNPIIVMKNYAQAEKEYLCIAGHTRLAVLEELGFVTCPSTILPENDLTFAKYYATIDNLVRNDLTPIEKANAFASVKRDLRLSTTDLAKKLGCSRQYATCILNIASWPQDLKDECTKNAYTLKSLFKFSRKKMSDDEARAKVATLKKTPRDKQTPPLPDSVKTFAEENCLNTSTAKVLAQIDRALLKISADQKEAATAFLYSRIKAI